LAHVSTRPRSDSRTCVLSNSARSYRTLPPCRHRAREATRRRVRFPHGSSASAGSLLRRPSYYDCRSALCRRAHMKGPSYCSSLAHISSQTTTALASGPPELGEGVVGATWGGVKIESDFSLIRCNFSAKGSAASINVLLRPLRWSGVT
jgi:hypothetical protein